MKEVIYVNEGIWPEFWKDHWIHPLFKKGSSFSPQQYFGLHLTSILSKSVEKVIACNLTSFLHGTNAYGGTQWAFRPAHSCRDLIALVTGRWLLQLHEGKRIAVYLSDISGAFDRVSTEILLAKLRAVGVAETLIRFLGSYLEARRATVLVQGQESDIYELLNMVFQGTVLGPPLWSIFFADVDNVIPKSFDKQKFADDLTASKSFPGDTCNDIIYNELKDCQERVHSWGEVNRAIFGSTKEAFAILDLVSPVAEDFRMLGTWFDGKMSMRTNVEKMAGKAKSKVAALLNCSSFYSTHEMVRQFKTHVLGLLELNIGGFYHAVDTVQAELDQIQASFLRKLDVSAKEAFLIYNLAPLTTRRDIAMLGLLYRCVHEIAHPDLQALFPRCHVSHDYSTRLQDRRHTFQLKEEREGTRNKLLERSMFGLVRISAWFQCATALGPSG